MQINYFNPSELAESPKAEDFRYGPPPQPPMLALEEENAEFASIREGEAWLRLQRKLEKLRKQKAEK